MEHMHAPCACTRVQKARRRKKRANTMAGESTVTVKSPMFGSCVYRSRETRVNNRRGNRDKSRPIFNDNEISFIYLIIKWILKLDFDE